MRIGPVIHQISGERLILPDDPTDHLIVTFEFG